jgi:CheY-like chemotaxis protein
VNGPAGEIPVALRSGDEQELAAAAEAEGARVLLVDDDERNLLAVATVLEDLGEVVLARSGEEALRHLLKGEFAVILLDVYMPGMDGYETAQIIRSRDYTKGIPIVFLSAVNKETEHLLRGYAMGAVDYVFKPVDPIILRSKVAVFVELFEKTKEVERKARREQALLDANLRANAERLRAEQELRRAEQRQAAIIQSLPMVLYLEPFDANPRWPTYVSGDLEAITGFSYDEIAARTRGLASNGFTRMTATAFLPRSRRGGRPAARRSNIAGSAPTAASSISSIRPCCSGMPRPSPSSSPEP